MVTAMDTAINRKVDGIGIPLIDPKAFNTATDKALDAGIPVIAYNTSAPSGSGNNAMAYVGQDLTAAGEAAGQHILKYVKKGDLVAGMIGVPGSLDEQPRIDGAKSVLTAAGVDFVEVGIGATQGPELSAVDSWYQGHQDVKFIYGVGSSEGIAVASTMKKYDLASKGIGGSSWDVGVPALQQVQAGHLAFTIDQQSYLQGFLTIMQLFLYQASGGMAHPVDTDTGLLFVNKDNVGPYLSRKDRFEGSTTSHQVTKAPSKISVGS
jgi:simple sugar transport system substrate-binding protein